MSSISMFVLTLLIHQLYMQRVDNVYAEAQRASARYPEGGGCDPDRSCPKVDHVATGRTTDLTPAPWCRFFPSPMAWALSFIQLKKGEEGVVGVRKHSP